MRLQRARFWERKPQPLASHYMKPGKTAGKLSGQNTHSDLLISNHKKWRLVRINYIDETLRTGKTLSVKDLTKKYEVSSKVIWKDVEVMREGFHRRVEYDPANNTYFYDEDYLEIAPL